MLDKQIERTIHASEALRDQTRLLHAEWTLLNDPSRLQTLADQFLKLKSVAPGQFTNLAELDNRLPAVPRQRRPPRPSRSPLNRGRSAGPGRTARSSPVFGNSVNAGSGSLAHSCLALKRRGKTASKNQGISRAGSGEARTRNAPFRQAERAQAIPPRPPSPLVAQASLPV